MATYRKNSKKRVKPAKGSWIGPVPKGMATPKMLVARGWTIPLMKTLLGQPDHYTGNPFRPSCPIRYFAASRVEAAEKTPEFKAAVSKAARAAARAGAARDAALSAAAAVTAAVRFSVPVYRPAELARLAYEDHNAWCLAENPSPWNPDVLEYRPGVDFETDYVARATAVWYLRRVLVGATAAELLGEFKVRKTDEVYRAFVTRALGEIAAAYPALAGECRRQADRVRFEGKSF